MKITHLTLIALVAPLVILSVNPHAAMAEVGKKSGKSHQEHAAKQEDKSQHAEPSVDHVDGNKIVDAEKQLASMKELFKHEGKSIKNVFDRLNEHTSINTEGRDPDVQDIKNTANNVRCIMNSKWVTTGTGKGVGTSAAGPVLDLMVAELRKSPEKGVARVTYTQSIASPIGGAPISQQVTAVVASSNYLMGQKNNSGQKFLCFVEVN